jgi:hypothetical protein
MELATEFVQGGEGCDQFSLLLGEVMRAADVNADGGAAGLEAAGRLANLQTKVGSDGVCMPCGAVLTRGALISGAVVAWIAVARLNHHHDHHHDHTRPIAHSPDRLSNVNIIYFQCHTPTVRRLSPPQRRNLKSLQ